MVMKIFSYLRFPWCWDLLENGIGITKNEPKTMQTVMSKIFLLPSLNFLDKAL
jgi:hypothetical protein